MPTPPIKKRHGKDQNEDKKETASRPLSAFMLFANDVRPRLEMENPSIKAVDLSSKLADSWHDLPEEEKLIYHRRSLDLYTRPDSDQKTFPRQKEEQKRKAPDRPEHCIIVPNGEMKLIDSPFIQKSKRRRYELPYKFPQSSEYQPRPRPPKPQPIKRPPPPRPLIRTYPTYKERIQMMERGLYHKQAPPHIGVFKRSEDNPDLLIVDESGQTTITFPNIERHNGYGKSYSIGPCVSGLKGNSYFHPRIIGNGHHYAQFQLASPSVNLIPRMYPQQFQRLRYPYLTNVHSSYIQAAPQLYQQTIPAQTSVYSEIKCSPVTTGSITVRYEPVTTESFENFEISDDEYLEQDPFLNINLNEDEIQIDGDEVEFNMMGLDSDQDIKEEEEDVCDDLDDINPTIAPFEEGIDQYLSLDGQPYVMIPVDMDVAKKLGWPIHMLPSMPKWLSKMADNEVTSTDVSSTELLDIPESDSSTQQSGVYNALDLEKETEIAVKTIKIEMPDMEIVKEIPEIMDFSESNTDPAISRNETDSKDDEVGNDMDTKLTRNPPVYTEDKMPTATGEIMDNCGDKKFDFLASIPDERGDQGGFRFSSTPNQSPLREEIKLKTVSDPPDEEMYQNFCQSPKYSPIKSVCQEDHLKREQDEAEHFKEVIRQEKNFSQNNSNCVSNSNTTKKPSIILESLLENSDTEMDDVKGTPKDGSGKEINSGHLTYGKGKDITVGGYMEKQKCSV
ncbi:uncharacterized protein LOC133201770 [Saccostrea echinata]|uniref:uncharacterized protein LOC133201770 n=1 Tax=Saccostrea echinata TaxID=191078 RepID=UPI002A81E60B|nr:uncharacterized protein LOC133201770 [Saccostrea echinata]